MARWSWLLSVAINLTLVALTAVPVVPTDDLEDDPDFTCTIRESGPKFPVWRETCERQFWPMRTGRPFLADGEVQEEPTPCTEALYFLDVDGGYCPHCLAGLQDYCGGRVLIIGAPIR